MLRLLPFLIIAFFVWYWLYTLNRLEDDYKKAFKRKSLIILIIVVLALLIATGRISWLVAPIAALFALFTTLFTAGVRALPFVRYWLKKNGAVTLNSASCTLLIDYRSQQINGTITAGPFKDNHLDSLSKQDFNEQLQWAASADKKGYRLLQLYQLLTQSQSQDHRASNASITLNRQQAFDILGLEEGASSEEIRKAHKTLMQKLHPDKGGNAYLAQLLNEAKAILLEE